MVNENAEFQMTEYPANLMAFDDVALTSPLSKSPDVTGMKQPTSDDDSILERWTSSPTSSLQIDKVRELEEDHARLSDSILTLSSHFAHIQFRLQQITMAPPETRDKLLTDLQEFASKPCIDLTEVKQEASEILKNQTHGQVDNQLDERRQNVLNLIRELKKQTDDLEKFAYENGSGDLPASEMKQRQKMVFDKLQEKIQLNIKLETLTEHELQTTVENGLNQILEPIKEKEQLVDQLQTQIIDLERFVGFLQKENAENATSSGTSGISSAADDDEFGKFAGPKSLQNLNRVPPRRQSSILGSILGGGKKFERNELKNTARGNHYGDQRARLEIAACKVADVLSKYSIVDLGDNIEGKDETTGVVPDERKQDEIFEWSEVEVVNVVRKEFCPALKELLEHGMRTEIPVEGGLLKFNGFGCFPDRSHRGRRFESGKHGGRALNHIWDVIVYFYEDRKQRELNDGTVGKLTQTFKLDNVAGKTVTSKELLMLTVENIITTHKRLKRTPDAMWKAFVSAAMNEKKLPGWIRIIFRSDFIVANCYQPWSYVAHTGCEDIRSVIEKFHAFHVDLPVDLAIRPFEYIKDAF